MVMNESNNLDYILERLDSNNAKIAFLRQLSEKSEISPEFAAKATYFLKSEFFPEEDAKETPKRGFFSFFKRRKVLEKRKDVIECSEYENKDNARILAKYAVIANLSNEAIFAYEMSGLLYEAAEIAQQFGLKEEAERLSMEYIDRIISRAPGRWYSLRDFAERKGLLEKAVEMYERAANNETIDIIKAQKLESGGDYALEKGLIKKAQEMYVKSSERYQKEAEQNPDNSYSKFSSLSEAMRMAKKAGDGKRLRSLFVSISHLLLNESFNMHNPRAEDTVRGEAKRYGLIEEMIDLDEKKRNYEKAGDTAKEYNQPEKAEKLYKEAIISAKELGDFSQALEIAKKAGLENEIQLLTSLQTALS